MVAVLERNSPHHWRLNYHEDFKISDLRQDLPTRFLNASPISMENTDPLSSVNLIGLLKRQIKKKFGGWPL